MGAYTGVAASNIGLGARTLTDFFRLAKVNAASGDLAPLEGEDLKEFVEDLGAVELLVIDEISMVSRVMLAHIHVRLREWRLATGDHDKADAPFGGIGIILAGDFGQLPPMAISPSFSLLNNNVIRDAREQKSANHGLRLFQGFDTVVRLRRIHRQPGASTFKESLLRTRDGAMTKEDHMEWRTHDLNDLTQCTLTPKERAYFEEEVPHLFTEHALAGQRNGFKHGAAYESRLWNRAPYCIPRQHRCGLAPSPRTLWQCTSRRPLITRCPCDAPVELADLCGSRQRSVGVCCGRRATRWCWLRHRR